MSSPGFPEREDLSEREESSEQENFLDTNPTTREYLHVAKMTAVVAGIVLAIYIAYSTVSFAPDVFMIGFLGVLFAVFLASLSRLLGRWTRIAYGWNLMIVSVLLFASLVAFTVFFGSVVYEQVQEAVSQFEAGGQQLVALADEYPPLRAVVDSLPFLQAFRAEEPSAAAAPEPTIQNGGQAPGAREAVDAAERSGPADDPAAAEDPGAAEDSGAAEPSEEPAAVGNATQLAMSVTREVGALAGRFFVTTFGLLTNFVLIVIVGLYLAASPHAYQRAPGFLFPPRVRPDVHRILGDCGETLWRWLLGRFFSMTLSGVGTAVFLYFFGVPSALLIGALTFLLGFIPNLGPLLAMAVAMFFVLPQGLANTAIVIGVLSFFELLESYLVAPLVTEHQVSLPPALVIFFQALMGICLGFLGLTIAAPLLAVAGVLFTEVYRKRVLDEAGAGTQSEPDFGSAPA